MIRWWWNTMEG